MPVMKRHRLEERSQDCIADWDCIAGSGCIADCTADWDHIVVVGTGSDTAEGIAVDTDSDTAEDIAG